MGEVTTFTIDHIHRVLPHRAPFLFVDRVIRLTPEKHIIAERTLHPEEFFFEGHFPGNPIMPGVLVTDALAQTSGLLWGLSKMAQGQDETGTPRLFFLASSSMKYKNPAIPGETVRLESYAKKSFGSLFSYEVQAYVGKKTVAQGTLTLAMIEGDA